MRSNSWPPYGNYFSYGPRFQHGQGFKWGFQYGGSYGQQRMVSVLSLIIVRLFKQRLNLFFRLLRLPPPTRLPLSSATRHSRLFLIRLDRSFMSTLMFTP